MTRRAPSKLFCAAMPMADQADIVLRGSDDLKAFTGGDIENISYIRLRLECSVIAERTADNDAFP